MAAGDFVSAILGTDSNGGSDGSYVDLTVAGMGTGGTYDYGMTGNNVPVAPKLIVHSVDLGFDTSGGATTVARTLLGTEVIRCPYDTRSVAGTYTSGTFLEDEVVTQAVSGATAHIVIGASSGPLLMLDQFTGSPNSSGVWTGGTSGATFAPSASPVQWGASNILPGPREFYDGTNTKIRIALSDYVYLKANTGAGNSGTACTIDLLSGFYTKSAVPTAAVTAGATTNNSLQAYPKVIGNWLMSGFDKIGATDTVRFWAGHRSANGGHPVACVIFTNTDTHSHTATATVTDMIIDSTLADALPICEYKAALNCSSFTQGDIVTRNAKAYPFVGDDNSILDTTVGGTAAPTPKYGPIKGVYDGAGTYAQSLAVVNASTGNDGTGVVSTVLATANASPFLTLKGAYDAVRAYNNTNYSRNNCGGSTIYMRTGNYAFMGGTPTVGTAPDVRLRFQAYPGDARSGVVINTTSGGKSAGLLVRFDDIKINAYNASGVFDPNSVSADYICVNCEIDSNDATNNPTNAIYPMFYRIGVMRFIRCLITNFNQGFKCYSTVNQSWAMIRGCTLRPTISLTSGAPFIFVGNLKDVVLDGFHISDNTTGQTWPTMTNQIIAYNYITQAINSSTLTALRLGTNTETHGLAMVQNVFENTLQTSPNADMQIAADSSTGSPVSHVIIWHNTIVGQRVNGPYNDLGSAAAYRRQWSQRNNYYDDLNVKSDTFSTANAKRIGNWDGIYGLGNDGEIDGCISGVGAPASFLHEFIGLNSYQRTSGTNASTFPMFLRRGSADGVSNGVGNGDYRPMPGSPLIDIGSTQVLPYDLNGNSRNSERATAGAYMPIKKARASVS